MKQIIIDVPDETVESQENIIVNHAINIARTLGVAAHHVRKSLAPSSFDGVNYNPGDPSSITSRSDSQVSLKGAIAAGGAALLGGVALTTLASSVKENLKNDGISEIPVDGDTSPVVNESVGKTSVVKLPEDGSNLTNEKSVLTSEDEMSFVSQAKTDEIDFNNNPESQRSEDNQDVKFMKEVAKSGIKLTFPVLADKVDIMYGVQKKQSHTLQGVRFTFDVPAKMTTGGSVYHSLFTPYSLRFMKSQNGAQNFLCMNGDLIQSLPRGRSKKDICYVIGEESKEIGMLKTDLDLIKHVGAHYELDAKNSTRTRRPWSNVKSWLNFFEIPGKQHLLNAVDRWTWEQVVAFYLMTDLETEGCFDFCGCIVEAWQDGTWFEGSNSFRTADGNFTPSEVDLSSFYKYVDVNGKSVKKVLKPTKFDNVGVGIGPLHVQLEYQFSMNTKEYIKSIKENRILDESEKKFLLTGLDEGRGMVRPNVFIPQKLWDKISQTKAGDLLSLHSRSVLMSSIERTISCFESVIGPDGLPLVGVSNPWTWMKNKSVHYEEKLREGIELLSLIWEYESYPLTVKNLYNLMRTV